MNGSHRAFRLSLIATVLLSLAAICCPGAITAKPRTAGRQTASVFGTVIDSITAQPLSGAIVELVREGSDGNGARTVESDSSGRFLFADVRPGRYLLGFLHPALDALGLEPSAVSVVVTGGASHRADLAIPSAATLRIALCGDRAVRDSTALIIGHARRARSRAPLDSAIVSVRWTPRARIGVPAPSQPEQRRVAPSPSGFFVICGAQSGDSIQLAATRNGSLAASMTLAIPASGLLQQDLLLSETSPRAVAAATVTPDSTTRGSQAATILVSGFVVAADGGLPIAGAIVGIAGGAVTRSDAQGAWRLAGVTAGTQTLAVRALRYAPLRVTISVAPQMPPVRIAMVRPDALLDTVSVNAQTEADPNLVAFLERRRTRGSGTFLSQEDITSRRATFTSDIFLSVQGGITFIRDTLGYRYVTMKSNTFQAARCFPALFVDGMSFRGMRTVDIDDLVRPDQIFGIEVYRASNAPAEFSEQDGCGTILIWTKR